MVNMEWKESIRICVVWQGPSHICKICFAVGLGLTGLLLTCLVRMYMQKHCEELVFRKGDVTIEEDELINENILSIMDFEKIIMGRVSHRSYVV